MSSSVSVTIAALVATVFIQFVHTGGSSSPEGGGFIEFNGTHTDHLCVCGGMNIWRRWMAFLGFMRGSFNRRQRDSRADGRGRLSHGENERETL
jgi:hypothetical protein